MTGPWASVVFALATMGGASDTDVTTLTHSQLAPGQSFAIETAQCVYRARLIDPASGECEMEMSTDGENFSPPRTVFLLGATAGRQANQLLVLMHEVKVGMRMELGLGGLDERSRLVSDEVTSIRVDK